MIDIMVEWEQGENITNFSVGSNYISNKDSLLLTTK
jgi:hypothetical protein